MILFIDTSDASVIQVALLMRADTFFVKKIRAPYKHAEKLLPAIKKIIEEKKVSWSSIQVIVVIQGEGPFTALRIGVVTANALSYAKKIPCLAIKKNDFQSFPVLYHRVMKELKKKRIRPENVVLPFYGKKPNITFSS